VPLDIAATASSEIETGARARLLEHLGRRPREDADGLAELLDVLEPDLGRVPLGEGGGGTLWHSLAVGRSGSETPSASDPARFEGLHDRARHELGRGRAVVLDTELGLVDGCQRLRGLEGWLADLLAAPAFADGMMENVTRVCADVLRGALQAIGGDVDAVVLYEDMAGQTRPLVSPELYRARIKPFHAGLVDVIRSESQAVAVLHCDGAVADLLPDFVEIGVGAVNPVQTSALGMEPHRLKRRFGRNLCFWGGFDATWALAFGRPRDVTREATRVLDALAPGGGYVFAPSHPIDAGVPPGHVLALVEAARDYRVPGSHH
jgi:uroporphyrinogen decarboxylase